MHVIDTMMMTGGSRFKKAMQNGSGHRNLHRTFQFTSSTLCAFAAFGTILWSFELNHTHTVKRARIEP
jgi:hypothetical protein